MWPFDANKVEKLADEALAPGALPSARKQAIAALMALPQKPRSLECYLQIALDPKQVWDTRYQALEAMKLSPNAAGVRVVLRCVESDLRNSALHVLGSGGMPAAVRETGPEAVAVLTRVLEQVEREADSRQPDRLLIELGALNNLFGQIDSPEARALQARLDPVWLQVRNRQVPGYLRRALTARYHQDVADAVKELERLRTPEAKAALEKFRVGESRLVEKTVIGGVGAREERIKQQVYTSEFGQQKCREELEQQARRVREWEARHPSPKPPPVHEAPPAAEVPVTPPDLAQDYVAASARGIEEELLDLLADQMPLLLRLHQAGSLAPLAAFLDAKGDCNGLALTTDSPGAADFSVGETIDLFRDQFRAMAPTGRIVASAVFYHGCHGPGRGYPEVSPARQEEEADCLVARLDHDSGQAVTAVIQYEAGADGAWRYAPAYYAMRTPDIFLDRDYRPLLPDRIGPPHLLRRPAQVSDHGTHPELMTLLEAQMPFVKSLMSAGSLAPVAAVLKPSGEIQGFMLFERDVWETQNMSTEVRDPIVAYPVGDAERTPEGAIRFFIRLFRDEAEKGGIVASVIFFHGTYTTPEAAELGIPPAQVGDVPNCLVAMLDHRLSQTKAVVQRYARDGQGEWRFKPAGHSSAFPSIFNETGTTFLDPLSG